ncbi:MAG: hypothetical protein Q8P67_21980 [archaeon]|nr:hypothetical protein [archaeon]
MAAPVQPARNLFFMEGWKQFLCRCPTCRTRLNRSHLEFLLNIPQPQSSDSDSEQEQQLSDPGLDDSSLGQLDAEEDSHSCEHPSLFDADVLLPHTRSPPYDPSIEDTGMAAFLTAPRFDHAAKIDALRSFCELSRRLRTYLRKEIIPRDAVVTKEDILTFFSDDQLPKRQRRR